MVVSGRGSNLRSLHEKASEHDYLIVGVVSNKPMAPALDYAVSCGLPTQLVDHHAYATRALFEDALAQAIDHMNPDVIALAGFLRVLGADFVRRYPGRLLNIHPSLLPSFPGLDTHRRALEAGVREHGATVHLVTEALDGGPIIAQAGLHITPTEDVATLAARVLALEHDLYPYVLQRWARGEVVRPLTHRPHNASPARTSGIN